MKPALSDEVHEKLRRRREVPVVVEEANRLEEVVVQQPRKVKALLRQVLLHVLCAHESFRVTKSPFSGVVPSVSEDSVRLQRLVGQRI
jgi:hypothetical protein